jgi:hypothetical protein
MKAYRLQRSYKMKFRQLYQKRIEQKRINAVSGKPLRSFSYIVPFIVLPLSRKSFSACYDIVRSVIVNFVNLQHYEKKGIIHIPVIYVDSKLDNKVPFTPEKVHIYLRFVPFFLSPVTMLIKRFGIRKARPLCVDYLEFIATLYNNAGSIYRYCLTTTHRPDYNEMRQFRFIHRNDPHYLCVPSLHVCIVTGCYAYFRALFKRENFTSNETTLWSKELYTNAVNITESVLYVKQHSVNCIPAALYMMTSLYPDKFSPEDAILFIKQLFLNKKDISETDRLAITSHIEFMYERLLLEGANCDDWRDSIKRWLVTYTQETGQSLVI